MCFQSDKSLPITKTTKVNIMSMETFKRLLMNVSLWNSALKLSWRGEYY
jgi:hypothetical protein